MAIEDWMGSDIDKMPQVTIRRCYNGTMVYSYNVNNDRRGDELVFQDETHLHDFIANWIKATASSK